MKIIWTHIEEFYAAATILRGEKKGSSVKTFGADLGAYCSRTKNASASVSR